MTNPPAPAAPKAKTMEDFCKSLGCNDAGAKVLIAAGLSDYNALLTFKDDDDVRAFCKQIRKDGEKINLFVEMNLIIMCGEARIRQVTNRNMNYLYEFDRVDLVTYQRRNTERESWKDPSSTDAPDAASISKNWVKGFEMLDEWIGQHVLDSPKIPLSFLTRVEPGHNKNYDIAMYPSLRVEFEKRVPIGTVNSSGQMVYKNWTYPCLTKLWTLLYAIFKEHAAYQYMKPYSKEKDGLKAYKALRDHYLGPNNVNNMAADLEKQFSTLNYSGETRRWNFEKYVNKHVELWNVAEDLKVYGYSGIDPTSRVRRLLSGIKTDKLQNVKVNILASTSLQGDFDRCVCLFKDFIAQMKADSSSSGTAQIAATGSSSQNRGRGRGGNSNHNNNNHSGNSNGNNGRGRRRDHAQVSSATVEDRYYTKEEYNGLSHEQKKALFKIREAKKRRLNGNDNNSNNDGGNRDDSASIQSLQAGMDVLVAAINSQQGTGNGNGSVASQETIQANNRTNPALSRTGGRS